MDRDNGTIGNITGPGSRSSPSTRRRATDRGGPRGGNMADNSTHFGFESVRPEDKQSRVNEVFRSVARRYDLMNDLMSAGLHRVWKDALVTALRPSKTRPFRHLDVAGGTGDVAFRILEEG